ncbi:MAG TPA: circumsporozoite protein [Allosphingosinicella sp.]|jgi:hypothetical protein
MNAVLKAALLPALALAAGCQVNVDENTAARIDNAADRLENAAESAAAGAGNAAEDAAATVGNAADRIGDLDVDVRTGGGNEATANRQ